MSITVTVSSKRQITLPAGLSRELNIRPGDKIMIVKQGSNIQLKPSTYDQELEALRKRAKAEMKKNGTWGTPWEEVRKQADEVRTEYYQEKYGSRA